MEDTLPTPRQSVDGYKRESLLSNFLKLYDKVKCNPGNEVGRLDSVDEQEFEWLKKKGEEGEIRGWNGIRLAGE